MTIGSRTRKKKAQSSPNEWLRFGVVTVSALAAIWYAPANQRLFKDVFGTKSTELGRTTKSVIDDTDVEGGQKIDLTLLLKVEDSIFPGSPQIKTSWWLTQEKSKLRMPDSPATREYAKNRNLQLETILFVCDQNEWKRAAGSLAVNEGRPVVVAPAAHLKRTFPGAGSVEWTILGDATRVSLENGTWLTQPVATGPRVEPDASLPAKPAGRSCER